MSSEQLALREIYQELVEINTTDSVGDNTRAAEAMAARLRAAGFPPPTSRCWRPAPRKGNLVARLRGTGAAQADPAARAPRRGRGPARGLDHRSVHARREGRLLLRARHRRRQGDGRDLRRHPDPLREGGLQARPRHHPGPDRRRGAAELPCNGVRWLLEQPPRPDRRGAGAQRGRRRRACADGSQLVNRRAGEREGADQTSAWRSRIPAATARGRARTTPSTSSPTGLVRLGAFEFPVAAERHHARVLRAHRATQHSGQRGR